MLPPLSFILLPPWQFLTIPLSQKCRFFPKRLSVKLGRITELFAGYRIFTGQLLQVLSNLRLPFHLFHHLSEEPGGVALQGACCVASCSGERNHNETRVGCIVSWTTAINCSRNWFRSISLRKAALKAATVRTASYLRRSRRRSMSDWIRWRKGWH